MIVGAIKPKQGRDQLPFKVGAALTILTVCLFLSALTFWPVVDDGNTYPNKWTYLKFAAPNEIGDFVAGIAGTLAFVWIIVTVWLQSRELGAQREQLALTREELKETRKATQEMAIAQSQQVGILVRQGEIFLDEKRSRDEDRARRLFDQKLDGFIGVMRLYAPAWYGVEWTYKATHEEQIGPNEWVEEHELRTISLGRRHLWNEANSDSIMKTTSAHIAQVDFILNHSGDPIITKPQSAPGITEVIEGLKELLVLESTLSADEVQRLKNLGIHQAHETLHRLSINEELWAKQPEEGNLQ